MKPPFNYFGGKRKIAALVWERFGDVNLFIEPFAGGLGVLLGRPKVGGLEVINDKDGLIVNFWRSVQKDPDAVCKYSNHLVSTIELKVIKAKLIRGVSGLTKRLIEDEGYYDAETAGLWVWGQNWSINWKLSDKQGRPTIQRRCLATIVDMKERKKYLQELADRLGFCIILCNDWSKAVTNGVTQKSSSVGVFLDPPYMEPDTEGLYNEGKSLSQEVHAWCIEHGDDPKFKIALCGWDGEYDLPNWDCVAWKAIGSKQGHRERIWFSPHCIKPTGIKPLDETFLS